MIPLSNPIFPSSDEEKTVIMLDYVERKKVVNREVSLIVYLLCVSKEMVCGLHLLTH